MVVIHFENVLLGVAKEISLITRFTRRLFDRAIKDFWRQVLDADPIVLGENFGAVNCILQLANVAWPRV
jgi:hypothetical protein